jgi:hypothetical protein
MHCQTRAALRAMQLAVRLAKRVAMKIALRPLWVCCWLAACAVSGGTANQIVALEPGLSEPAQALPALHNRALGLAIANCADLLAALRSQQDLGETTELAGFNAYTDCMAVALLRGGRALPTAASDLSHAGERIYRDLDLGSVASALAPRRPAEHYRLTDFPFDTVQIEPLSLQLQGNGFAYTFQVLAMGDFRGLGKAEWLVRFDERATTQGSYHKRSVLVLDAPPAPAALQASDAVDVIRAQKTPR